MNKPGSKNFGNFHSRARIHFRNLTTNEDIEGSTANTLKRGIKLPADQNARVTNPLDPQYKYLGNTEVSVKDMNDPYGEKGCSMSKTNFAKSQ